MAFPALASVYYAGSAAPVTCVTVVKTDNFEAAGSGDTELDAITGWVFKAGKIGVTDEGASKEVYIDAALFNGDACAYWSDTPKYRDQRVELTIKAGSTSVGGIGPAVRVQSGANSYYFVYVQPGLDGWSLNKMVAGSITELDDDDTSDFWTVGDKIALVVTGAGSATRLKVERYTGGSWSTLVSDVDPGDYLGVGYGGIFGTASTGDRPRFDDFNWCDPTGFGPDVQEAVASYTPSATLRNNFSDWVGCKYDPQANMTVTALGRWIVAGNSGTHSVRMLDTDGTTVLGTVSIDTSLGTPGGFYYVDLMTPISLTSGQQVYVMSLEVDMGDQWYDYDGTLTMHADVDSVTGAYGDPPALFGLSGEGFVPTSFKFTIP